MISHKSFINLKQDFTRILEDEPSVYPQVIKVCLELDFDKPHLFHIQNQKRNQGTLIETGRNRPVSRNQTAILAGTLKSSSKFQITRPLANQKNPFNLLSMQREKVGGFSYKAFYKFKIGTKCYLLRL